MMAGKFRSDRRQLLLLSSTLAVCTITAAEAAPDPTKKIGTHTAQHASTTPTATGTQAGKPEVIHVSGMISNNGVNGRDPGGGLMKPQSGPKTKQTVTRDFISKQSPTSNPVQLLAMMPGANTASSDPFGLQGSTISVRGMNSSQIGWLFEGAPLNDIGNGSFYANEVVDAENLREVSLTPGSANIDTPTVSASGGLVEMNMVDPSHRRGGMVDLSYGSYNTSREFIRLESGDIGHSGVRMYGSFSNVHGNDWRGPGKILAKQADFKLVKDWNDGSRSALVMTYADQDTQEDLYPTLADYQKYGNSQNYNYSANAGGTNYYKLHRNMFQSMMLSMPNKIVAGHNITVNETPYFYYGFGNGGGASTLKSGSVHYGNSATGSLLYTPQGQQIPAGTSVLAYTPSIARTARVGNTLSATFHVANHNITAGWWYEWSDKLQQTVASQVYGNGQAASIWGEDYAYTLADGERFRSRAQTTQTQVNMLFIEDQMDLLHKHLHLQYGFKDAMVNRDGYNYIPGAPGHITTWNNVPLPQVAMTYRFNKNHQIYVVGATNFRLSPNTSMFNVYSQSTGKLSTGASSQKPEYSIEEEIGYRYTSDLFLADIAFFNYNFTNRQLSLPIYQNGALISQNINAGGQTSRGVDIEFATRPIWHHLRPFASFEYLHTSIDSNLPTTDMSGSNNYLPTKGKEQIMSPSIQAALGLDYDDGNLFINADIKYIGKQYSTFMNDAYIPGYFTDNVTIGYRFHHMKYVHAPQVQLNLANIADAKERTGVYSFGTNANSTTGTASTSNRTISGSQPTYYLMPGVTAMISVSAGF